MSDQTEQIRRDLQQSINAGETPVEGQTWTTEELTKEFEVMGFMAPFVIVRRRSDGQVGSLSFRHHPRIYFGWVPDHGE